MNRIVWIWLGLAACDAAPKKAAPKDEVRHVPFEETALGKAEAAGLCATQVDQLLAQPTWSLGVADHEWRDSGESAHRRYQVEQDGTLRFEDFTMVRTATLDASELAALRTLGGLDCKPIEPPDGYSAHPVTLSARTPGAFDATAPETPLATADLDSALGGKVIAILQGAIDRRAEQEVARLAPIALHLKTDARPPLIVDLKDHTLTRREGKAAKTVELTSRAVIDLVESIVTLPAGETAYLTGTLTAGGKTTKVTVSYSTVAFYQLLQYE